MTEPTATAADTAREDARAAYERAVDAASRGDSAAFMVEVNTLIRQDTAAAEEMTAILFSDSRLESVHSKELAETAYDYVPRWSRHGLDAVFARHAVQAPTAGLMRVLDPGDLEANADFRTQIEEGLAREPDFAGTCVVVEWGCGSGCQAGVILDLANGRI